MKAACTMDMLATDIADYLVRKGVSAAWRRNSFTSHTLVTFCAS
jgi:hypothetical protein